jgi:glycosyltransferase involved in cell wall biosynthesis
VRAASQAAANAKAATRARLRIGVHLYFPPSLGGGERYLLTAAEALWQIGDVDFLCPRVVDVDRLQRDLGLDLSRVRFVPHPWRRFHGLRDWLRRPPYDLFLALDNHLEPMQVCLGRRGILHLQTPPYPSPFRAPLRSRVKLRSYDVVVCNSDFTRRWAARRGTAGLPVRVVHPPIDLDLYRPQVKKPVILSVGRFFVGRHEKKHALLIDCFRDLVRGGLDGWELHLAGSIRAHEPEHVEYLEHLRRQAMDLPVRFFVDAPLQEMRRLYGEAAIYWHATGHGVNEDEHPQHLEHFGMAVAEAMAAEAIPVVIRKGGLTEIVVDGENGFLWDEPSELVNRTRELAAADPERLRGLRAKGSASVRRFGKERFVAEILALARQLVDAGS